MTGAGVLATLACVLSSGVWLAVGLYKLTHVERMTEVVRRHGIPFPAVAFWLSVGVELGGAALMLSMQKIWIAALLWLGFLIVATPVFHGRVLRDGTIDYVQLVHVGKNFSIAGGLLALLVLDGTVPAFMAGFWG